MTAGSFPDLEGMRPEIDQALSRLVAHWAEPGSWWTAGQRLALATVVRTARAGPELPPWQSPRTVAGLIDPAIPLGDDAVDIAWRITNHPGTLTHEWYRQATDDGLDPAAYVELVGVVSMANALEFFCHGVGVEAPVFAEPSPDRSTGAVGGEVGGAVVGEVVGEVVGAVVGEVSSHWVPTVAGDRPNIRTALSAAPTEALMQVVLLDALYVPGGALAVELDEKVWSLERTQVELVAARVSTLNECFY